MDSIESFALDSNLDPASVSLKVLANTFPGVQSLSVKDLDNFLRGLVIMQKEEVELIINEIKYLQSIKNTTSSEDIAMLLRDSTERHAK